MKRIPEWFRQSRGKLKATRSLSQKLQREVPNSICEEAKCPNRSECFAKGVLTFMILGTVCTRNCKFCSVAFGRPLPPDTKEIDNILHAIKTLNLRFVVITSPNRDDLKDEGSGHYAETIQKIKTEYPNVKVEVLIPDFKGKEDCLKTVVDANPDVINHNIETVPRLYKVARKGSLFNRSIQLLKNIKKQNPKKLTKTGVMVGLGETTEELIETFKVVKEANVDILTIGQYLKPSKDSLEVDKYYHPDEFAELKKAAKDLGIKHVFSGPSVRSSYLADEVFEELDKNEHELVLS